jgi:hypothetical protein
VPATRLALAALLVALAAPAASDGARGQPGLWEITATVELPGQALPLPPTTQTECLSQADLDADPAPVIDRGACRATDVRRSGDTVTWKVACDGAAGGTGEGEITFRGPAAYDGSMVMELAGTRVRTTLRARRVGDCPKGR